MSKAVNLPELFALPQKWRDEKNESENPLIAKAFGAGLRVAAIELEARLPAIEAAFEELKGLEKKCRKMSPGYGDGDDCSDELRTILAKLGVTP